MAGYRSVELGLEAWEAALRAGAGEALSEQEWAELAAAGIAADEQLDPNWGMALRFHTTAQGGFRVGAAYRGVLLQTDVTISANGIVTSLRQRRAETDDGVLLDPKVEFLVGLGEAWELVRRGLPPLEQLQAAPRQTDTELRFEYSGDPAELDELTEARVSLLAYTEATGDLGMGLQLWYVLPQGLLRIVDGTAQLVEPGDLGYQVVFYGLGIADSYGRGEQS